MSGACFCAFGIIIQIAFVLGGGKYEGTLYKAKGIQPKWQIYRKRSAGEGCLLHRGQFYENPKDFLHYEYKKR